jgi:F420-dependent oxidoreductase-like protein
VTDDFSTGVLLWSQGTDWDQFARAAQRVDELGYDQLWTWDHVYAIFGDPYQPIFDGWLSLAAWAGATSRVRLGTLCTANTFRNPALVAKLAATLDHVSHGRAMLGIGGAWHELEHTAHGIDFGRSAGERLDRLAESVAVIRRLLDGATVTHEGEHYRFSGLRHHPAPVQPHLPLMIGGGGERKTLPIVARYADWWNAFGSVEALSHKAGVLRRLCEEAGRDPAEIVFTVGCKPLIRDREADARRLLGEQMERNRTPMSAVADDPSFWVGTPAQVGERIAALHDSGFRGIVAEMAAPYDDETLDRLVNEVVPAAL